MPRAGGSATIYGVIYQVLGTLVESCSVRLVGAPRDGELNDATLVVEPDSGGDAQVHHGAERRVIQWKSRAHAGTWSLAEIASEVVPDLYLAVPDRLSDQVARYRFVTEGRKGAWPRAEAFFSECRGAAPNGLPGCLDDTERVGSIRGKPVTRRRLFRTLATLVRKRRGPRGERASKTYRKLWNLLGSLEFEWGRTTTALRQQVDTMIYDLTGDQAQIPAKRHDLQSVILDMAAEGGAPVAPREILRRAGLDVGSLRNWPRLRERLRGHLGDALRQVRYTPEHDVRAPASWPPERPVLILSGESGQGKTWGLAALALMAGSGSGVAVWLRARGEAERDLDEVAKIICQHGLGHTQGRPFLGLVEWRARVAANAPRPWLSILIDDVQAAEAEARSLVRQPWREWGARVALTSPPELARTLAQEFPDRVHLVEVGDFNDDELRDFLRRSNCEWGAVPPDLRPTLRRPLLAAVYCQLGASPLWRPQREYELYESFWLRLKTAKDQQDHPQDVARLRALARRILGPSPTYPWTFEEQRAEGVDDEGLQRLEAVGWLRRHEDGRVEIWHDRLLNWAVAEALIEDRRAGRLTAEDLSRRLSELFATEGLHAGRSLTYVPMDVLWLLAGDGNCPGGDAAAVIEAIETNPRRSQPDLVYQHLLPTIGRRVIPAMIARVRATEGREYNPYPRLVADAIRSIVLSEPAAAEDIATLVADSSAAVQETAELVLSRFPSAAALDPIWNRHAADLAALPGNADVLRWGRCKRRKRALTACTRLRPSWLFERVLAIEDPRLLEELASLLLAVDREAGRQAWERSKERLIASVPAVRAAVLADCISHFGDATEVGRLESWLRGPADSLASHALAALAVTDPKRALLGLEDLPPARLSRTRGTWLPELMLREREGVRRVLGQRFRGSSEGVWDLACAVYDGYEWLIDPDVVDVLLDWLQAGVAAACDVTPESALEQLGRALHLMARAVSWEALARFEARAGSPLEGDLALLACAWAGATHCGELEDAKRILLAIGPSGPRAVARAELGHSDRATRLGGLRTCLMGPDASIRGLVRGLAARDSVMSDSATRQETAEAVLTLAALGDNRGVLDAILRWGLEVCDGVAGARRGQPPMPDEDLQPALLALAGSDDGQRTNAILAVAVSGRQDLCGRVRAILERAQPADELARAAVIALADLDDRSVEAFGLFRRQLDANAHRWEAVRALLWARATPEAMAILEADLRRAPLPLSETHLTVAINLASNPPTARIAAEALWAHMSQPSRIMESPLAIESLVHLDNDNVRAFLREEAFPFESPVFSLGGRKTAAIRALAQLDRGAGFAAAELGLKQGLHDVEAMPLELVRMDAVRAIPLLVQHLQSEPRATVRSAIAWALRRSGHPEAVREQLTALLGCPSPLARRRAAEAAASLGPGLLENSLRRLLVDDPEAGVRNACQLALLGQWRERIVRDVLLALRSAPPDRRWPLVEIFLDFADPHLMADRKDPIWLWGVLGDMPEALGRHARRRREESLGDHRRALEAADRQAEPTAASMA